jgi:DNA replication and repair protein RecF
LGWRSIRLFNYRNLENSQTVVDAAEVFLVGENGQGKTNFLEAVHCLCLGSAFRTRRDQELVRHGQTEMAISGDFTAGGEERRVLLKYADGRKTVALDDKNLADRKELLRRFPCVVFCHADIEFVSGAPDFQRLFFNQTLCLFDFLYVDGLRRYQQLLRSRNLVLKERQAEVVEVFDRQLAAEGVRLQAAREALVGEFNLAFAELFGRVSGRPVSLSVRYRPSWPAGAAADIERHLAARRERDFAFGMTTSGPHRDRFEFVSDGRDFAASASTGQVRLVSLILRVAQALFVLEKTGAKPVLLLDDVLLELDPARRRRFLAELPPYEQAFFTFLPDEQYRGYARSSTRLYSVQDGTMQALNGTG